ncbi:PASTA domain-containing protein [Leptospira kobayashii]|uniref:PASTA domain-containing protein n=1 Tax=Leptospira kobayashii TaxID=1917830 RepID=A0ABM7UJL5_9LEPT|nr:PASTA domain-containing protein [Leptospira kobayashii]BDA78925.1 PASTA domain-containing protein [Leptospira kobayashii]
MKEKFLKILPYSGYVLFISLGLLIFFVGAFLVVVVRTKDEQKVTMPLIIGKNYIEVHNELQRLQLKVRLETLRIPEKTDGVILSQSIDPGKEVEAGSKLYVTVNVGFDRITVPDLKGQDLKRAKAVLEKVLAGDVYVPLTIGGITYVPSVGDEPPDTVIDQIPAPGKETHSGEKIFLLVTESSAKEKTNQSNAEVLKESDFLGVPLPFAVDSFQRRKIPYTITEFKKPEFRDDNGKISSIKLTPKGAVMDVNFLKAEEKLNYVYESVSYEVDDKDIYTATLTYTDERSGNEVKKDILSSQNLEEDQVVNLAFYRSKETKLTLVGQNTGEAKSWTFKGKY